MESRRGKIHIYNVLFRGQTGGDVMTWLTSGENWFATGSLIEPVLNQQLFWGETVVFLHWKLLW